MGQQALGGSIRFNARLMPAQRSLNARSIRAQCTFNVRSMFVQPAHQPARIAGRAPISGQNAGGERCRATDSAQGKQAVALNGTFTGVTMALKAMVTVAVT